MELKEFEAQLSDVESRLDRLRALYEQYFQGIERLEPLIPRKELDRRFDQLRRRQPRNTALRFRFQQALQKYVTYQTYWRRVARQIEEGTYRRDILKARRRREDMREERKREREGEAGNVHELDLDQSFDLDAEVEAALDALRSPSAPPPPRQSVPPAAARSALPPKRPSLSPFALPGRKTEGKHPGPPGAASTTATFGKPADPAAKRSFGRPAGARPPPVAKTGAAPKVAPPRPAPPPPPAKRPPQPPQKAGQGPDIRQVYERYVEARRRNNEPTDNVRYETVERNIKKMLPKLQQKHQGKKIDFEVVLKDGRVGLKPVPK